MKYPNQSLSSAFALLVLFAGLALLVPSLSGMLLRSGELRAQSVPSIQLIQGRKVFEKRCVLCHGATGLGDGPNAAALPVRPANLQSSRLTDLQKEYIIRLGGAAVGRSSFMPPWGQELKTTEVRNLILYLRAINVR